MNLVNSLMLSLCLHLSQVHIAVHPFPLAARPMNIDVGRLRYFSLLVDGLDHISQPEYQAG